MKDWFKLLQVIGVSVMCPLQCPSLNLEHIYTGIFYQKFDTLEKMGIT